MLLLGVIASTNSTCLWQCTVQMLAGSIRTKFNRNHFSSLGLWTAGQTASLRTHTLAFSLQFCWGMRKKKCEYSIEHRSCCLQDWASAVLFTGLSISRTVYSIEHRSCCLEDWALAVLFTGLSISRVVYRIEHQSYCIQYWASVVLFRGLSISHAVYRIEHQPCCLQDWASVVLFTGLSISHAVCRMEHQSCCLHPSKTDILFHKLRYYFLIYLFIYLLLWTLPTSHCRCRGYVASDHTQWHTHTHTHTVELPWRMDRTVSEMSTWPNTTLTRDRYPYTRRDSKPHSLEASVHRLTP